MPPPAFQPADPDYHQRLRETVLGQPMMQMLGVELTDAKPGDVTVRLAHDDRYRQHHGYLHGGVTAMLADEVCGLTALSLVAAHQRIVTSDLSVTFLRPGVGATAYDARAVVVRPGRNLTACRCTVRALAKDGTSKEIAIAQATTMTLDNTHP